MMSAESQDQIDMRVPPEIWERIFTRLYPSQLTRVSMVNKNLNAIVSSFEVWRRMFYVAHGPKAQLRQLIRIPKTKSSYMMFMCASSHHVCEKCFSLTGYNAGKLYKLPLPIPVILPRRSTDVIKYVGDRADPFGCASHVVGVISRTWRSLYHDMFQKIGSFGTYCTRNTLAQGIRRNCVCNV